MTDAIVWNLTMTHEALPEWLNKCGLKWEHGTYSGTESWRGKLPGSEYEYAEIFLNSEGTWCCLAGACLVSPCEATREEALMALLVYLRLDVPADAASISLQFKAELRALLAKYGAEIEASDHYTGYAECGEDIRMIVSVDLVYDASSGDCLRENCEIDLGSSFDGKDE